MSFKPFAVFLNGLVLSFMLGTPLSAMAYDDGNRKYRAEQNRDARSISRSTDMSEMERKHIKKMERKHQKNQGAGA